MSSTPAQRVSPPVACVPLVLGIAAILVWTIYMLQRSGFLFPPRTAASAALPWAIIRPPLRGSGKAKTIEPAAACASVCECAGTIASPGYHRSAVSGGCGSAWRPLE
ncbi:MAG: hypothetical protein NT154_26130 [Verrucomicrobia bacterium]|nr:hypothetical protein [Verrucomicrobiota bacterium]